MHLPYSNLRGGWHQLLDYLKTNVRLNHQQDSSITFCDHLLYCPLLYTAGEGAGADPNRVGVGLAGVLGLGAA